MAARWPPLHLCTAAAAVFLLTLILPRTPAEGKPSAQPHAVPAPFNLKITSYNLNSTLYWDYERSSATHFQVEIKNYSKGAVWTLVKNCKNIKHNYCDLSKNIVNPDTFYYIRVKAFNGIAASDYSEMEFSLRVDGIIGPPRLNLSLEGKSIIIDILHPPVPHLGRKTTVSDFYKDFDYKIFFQNNTEHQTEECDEQKCTAYLFPSTKDAYYCFSAQGWSEDYAVLGEKSEEACIFVPDEEAIKSFRTKIIMATAFGVFFSVLVILIIIFVINAMMKSKTNLPKSLNSVVRNFRGQFKEYPESETKYDIISTSTSCHDVTEKLKKSSEDVHLHTETADLSDSSQTDAYPGYQGPLAETEEQKSVNSTEKCDDEMPVKEESSDYFHTDIDNEGEVTLDSETPLQSSAGEKESCPESKPSTNSYGYDKPHVPLHLIIQMNKEEYGIDQLPINNC